jgi:hypothetical protein
MDVKYNRSTTTKVNDGGFTTCDTITEWVLDVGTGAILLSEDGVKTLHQILTRAMQSAGVLP